MAQGVFRHPFPTQALPRHNVAWLNTATTATAGIATATAAAVAPTVNGTLVQYAGQGVTAAISVDYQYTADVDAVYVQGSTPAGSGAFWISQLVGLGFSGVGLLAPRSPARMVMVQAAQATDAFSAAQAAYVELVRRQGPATITMVVTGFDGWFKGQAIFLTSTVYGWTAKQFVVTSVNMVVLSGTAIRQYTITAGTDPISFRRRMSAGVSITHNVAATRVMGTLTAGGSMPTSG